MVDGIRGPSLFLNLSRGRTLDMARQGVPTLGDPHKDGEDQNYSKYCDIEDDAHRMWKIMFLSIAISSFGVKILDRNLRTYQSENP
jgi:hypothetical protein